MLLQAHDLTSTDSGDTYHVASELVDVTIVIPTYCEAENLRSLIPRLDAVLARAGLTGEIVVVDDASPDGTEMVCRELATGHPVRCLVRRDERGLSSAVVTGLHAANGRSLVVMDADLSHPPEAIPGMLARLASPDVDFVIGSRYVDGGSTADDWGLLRWLNSRVATLLARPLTAAKDPMAGFFALRRETFENCERRLAPIGYKIGLELIVKGDCKSVAEVPIHFADRAHGESKLNLREQWKYLRHVGRLYAHKSPGLMRLITFGMVGLSGLVVDLSALKALRASGLSFELARALSLTIAIVWNYSWNRRQTFGDRRSTPRIVGFVRYCAGCSLGALANWTASASLHAYVAYFATHEWLAAVAGVAVGFALNFLVCDRWVFRDTGHAVADSADEGSQLADPRSRTNSAAVATPTNTALHSR